MQDPSAEAQNQVADSSNARNNLPPAFQYGPIDTVSLNPSMNWKYPDSGNASYTPTQQVVFYLPTGGAAMLSPNLYITCKAKFDLADSTSSTNNMYSVMLDYNVDSLIQETQLQLNGTLVEHLQRANKFANIQSTLYKKSDYSVPVDYNQFLLGTAADVVNQPNITNATTGLYTDPHYRGQLIRNNATWIGQSIYYPRQGNKYVNISNGTPANVTGTVTLKIPIKSFLIGEYAVQYLPLAFLNQVMYTIILESATIALTNTSYVIATAALVAATWTYTLSEMRLHYNIVNVQDEIAASIQKAYLQNSLPQLMHAGKTYQWVQSVNQPSGTVNSSIQFTVSGNAFDELIFIIERANDYTSQDSRSLSNWPGGIVYAQLTVNGQKIPQNRIENDYHPSEMFDLLGYNVGVADYCNSNINLNFPAYIPSGAGALPTTVAPANFAGDIYNTSLVGYQVGGQAPGVPPRSWGFLQTDIWNAPMTDWSTTVQTKKQQGCTILPFSLSDKQALKGWNVKSPVAIRGNNIQLDLTLSAGTTTGGWQVTLFAVQENVLIMKGTTVSVLS